MTAEMAIMNKSGVALAADSKVTIGAGQKTFDTVNKVFTLSKIHPVGIMIFGNAEFMRYPWETIVKTYRGQKKDGDHATISEWADDFVSFLKNFGDTTEAEIAFNINATLSAFFLKLQDQVRAEALRNKVSIPSAEYIALLTKTIEQRHATLLKLPDLFDEAYQSAFMDPYGAIVAKLINEQFSGIPDKTLVNKARELALLSLFKEECSPSHTGIVVAGFGGAEMFPSLIEYQTDGYIGRAIKIKEERRAAISRAVPSAIVAFAQHEMVQRFMTGADGELMAYSLRQFARTLERSCNDVLARFAPGANTEENRQVIAGAVNDAMAKLVQNLGEVSDKNFSQPIVNMISLLPKDELPHVAESLVALTSLKRHVSHDIETVGGPIDVALISKGDGFVWIKRKHYFKSELNPQFALNYLRDI